MCVWGLCDYIAQLVEHWSEKPGVSSANLDVVKIKRPNSIVFLI
jgi:hypothetical protein